MKHKKYTATAFLALLLLPFFSARPTAANGADFDVKSIQFIELEQQIELGFATADYLPKGFNPYKQEVSISGINFMEEENIDLGFEPADYLPENFNPYKK